MKRLRYFSIIFFLVIANFGYSVGYVRIGGVVGDSKDSNHQGWIEVISFNQEGYRWTQKDGAVAPKSEKNADGGQMTLTRYARNPITDLYKAAVYGTYFSNMTVDLPENPSQKNKFSRLNLSDITVEEITIHRPKESRGVPVEQVTLHFDHARWE